MFFGFVSQVPPYTRLRVRVFFFHKICVILVFFFVSQFAYRTSRKYLTDMPYFCILESFSHFCLATCPANVYN